MNKIEYFYLNQYFRKTFFMFKSTDILQISYFFLNNITCKTNGAFYSFKNNIYLFLKISYIYIHIRKINLSCHYLRRNDHLRRILLKKPIIIIEYPHQWRSGSVLKAGRQEMPSSIPRSRLLN